MFCVTSRKAVGLRLQCATIIGPVKHKFCRQSGDCPRVSCRPTASQVKGYRKQEVTRPKDTRARKCTEIRVVSVEAEMIKDE